jgi:hypothetical protein
MKPFEQNEMLGSVKRISSNQDKAVGGFMNE